MSYVVFKKIQNSLFKNWQKYLCDKWFIIIIYLVNNNTIAQLIEQTIQY